MNEFKNYMTEAQLAFALGRKPIEIPITTDVKSKIDKAWSKFEKALDISGIPPVDKKKYNIRILDRELNLTDIDKLSENANFQLKIKQAPYNFTFIMPQSKSWIKVYKQPNSKTWNWEFELK